MCMNRVFGILLCSVLSKGKVISKEGQEVVISSVSVKGGFDLHTSRHKVGAVLRPVLVVVLSGWFSGDQYISLF